MNLVTVQNLLGWTIKVVLPQLWSPLRSPCGARAGNSFRGITLRCEMVDDSEQRWNLSRLETSVRNRFRSTMMNTEGRETGNQAMHYSQWVSLQSSPNATFFEFFFGIHTSPDLPLHLRGRVIHPLSPFMVCVNMVSAILTVYCFFELPILIAFHWNAHPCWRPATLELDMAVEMFFLMEVSLGFCIGHYTSRGTYVSSFRGVAINYVRSGRFFFDLLTAAPITWMEFIIVFAGDVCESGDKSFGYIKAPLRLLRPLRLLKVAKLLRILKVMQELERIFQLELWLQRLLNVGALFFCVVHVFNCSFWLIKTLSVDEEELAAWIASQGIDENSKHYTFELYVLSGYFCNTVFTTVGFGDITGTNWEERLFIITMMWVGTICFSVVMSEVELVWSGRSAAENERKVKLSGIKSLLNKENVPRELEQEILEWIDMSHSVETERHEQLELVKQLPSDLQDRLILHLTKALLESLAIVRRVPPDLRDQLLTAMARGAAFTIVRRDTLIATQEELLAGRLFVIVSGRVRLENNNQSLQESERPVQEMPSILVRGDYFGMLDPVAAGTIPRQQHLGAAFVADRTSELAFVTRELVESMLSNLSPEVQRCVAEVPASVPLYTFDGRHGDGVQTKRTSEADSWRTDGWGDVSAGLGFVGHIQAEHIPGERCVTEAGCETGAKGTNPTELAGNQDGELPARLLREMSGSVQRMSALIPNESCPKRQGSVVCSQKSSDSAGADCRRSRFGFTLTDSAGEYQLVCSVETPQERDTWVHALRTAAAPRLPGDAAVSHAGPVRKRGHINTAFANRYMVLADGKLEWYKKEQDSRTGLQPLGVITCSGIEVCVHDSGKASGRSYPSVRDFRVLGSFEEGAEYSSQQGRGMDMLPRTASRSSFRASFPRPISPPRSFRASSRSPDTAASPRSSSHPCAGDDEAGRSSLFLGHLADVVVEGVPRPSANHDTARVTASSAAKRTGSGADDLLFSAYNPFRSQKMRAEPEGDGGGIIRDLNAFAAAVRVMLQENQETVQSDIRRLERAISALGRQLPRDPQTFRGASASEPCGSVQ